ncbi:hypothetical protein [Chitinophaga rhizosphaerae]|uniref:hypothetical protein n=1 Tax=Chitinophaga rhizosphaerae TaxID=1864947 RepID=UPI000F7FD519|nr:hypothetical protein [Chitinophaga rhizosphaerae]
MIDIYKDLLTRRGKREILQNHYPVDYSQEEALKEMEPLLDKIYLEADKCLQTVREAIGAQEAYLIINYDPVNSSAGPNGLSNVTPYVVAGWEAEFFQTIHYHCSDWDDIVTDLDCPKMFSALKRGKIGLYNAMMEYTSMTVHYHELAHLVQRKGELQADYRAPQGAPGAVNDVPISHLSEIDADNFAMDLLAQRIAGKFDPKDVDQALIPSIEGEIGLAIASNIRYWVLAKERTGKDIYFAEESHPHPFIRMHNMQGKLFEALKMHLPDGIVLDEEKVMAEAYQLTERMCFVADFIPNCATEMKEAIVANREAIEQYLIKVEQQSKSIEELCVHQDKINISVSKATRSDATIPNNAQLDLNDAERSGD